MQESLIQNSDYAGIYVKRKTVADSDEHFKSSKSVNLMFNFLEFLNLKFDFIRFKKMH